MAEEKKWQADIFHTDRNRIYTTGLGKGNHDFIISGAFTEMTERIATLLNLAEGKSLEEIEAMLAYCQHDNPRT
jgi:hypothetical protein